MGRGAEYGGWKASFNEDRTDVMSGSATPGQKLLKNNLPCLRKCGSASWDIGSPCGMGRRLGTYGFIHRAVSNLSNSEGRTSQLRM